MKAELYTVDYCPYCKKALAFLEQHNVDFTDHDITANEDVMRKQLGKKFNISGDVTVPQIVIDGKHIGGYSDMIALYEEGKLNFS